MAHVIASWSCASIWGLRTVGWLAVIAVVAGCRKPDEPELPSRVFVSNEDDGTVSVIDPHAVEVVATIAVGKRPRGLRVTGDTLYVALSGSPKAPPGTDVSALPPPDRAADGIGVVDLKTLRLVHVLPSGQDPEAFDLVGDDLLVVSNEETGEASIVDLGARKVRARLQVGAEPEGVTTAPDGLVWVTSESDNLASAIDPRARRVVAIVATGARPRAIAFDPAGRRGLVTNENDGTLTILDATSRTAAGRIVLPTIAGAPARPMGVVFDRDGRHAYVATGRAGAVVVVDVEARAVVRVVERVGARPWGIALGPDGRLYTANGPSNDVAVIDPGTGVVATIEAGRSPWGVAVRP
jgi:YVTN family beta-propeller protein